MGHIENPVQWKFQRDVHVPFPWEKFPQILITAKRAETSSLEQNGKNIFQWEIPFSGKFGLHVPFKKTRLVLDSIYIPTKISRFFG